MDNFKINVNPIASRYDCRKDSPSNLLFAPWISDNEILIILAGNYTQHSKWGQAGTKLQEVNLSTAVEWAVNVSEITVADVPLTPGADYKLTCGSNFITFKAPTDDSCIDSLRKAGVAAFKITKDRCILMVNTSGGTFEFYKNGASTSLNAIATSIYTREVVSNSKQKTAYNFFKNLKGSTEYVFQTTYGNEWRNTVTTLAPPNVAPTVPTSLDVPTSAVYSSPITVQWGSSTDADGNLAGYMLEHKLDSGTWAQIYQGTARSFDDSVEYGTQSVQYRVKAYDTEGAESDYLTSQAVTIINNRAPSISGSDSDLGQFTTTPPSFVYTVSDADGDELSVIEALDGVPFKTHTPTLNTQYTCSMTAEEWQKVLNGSHTLTITATDPAGDNAVRKIAFTKQVLNVAFETKPMEADAMPTKAAIQCAGAFPSGSVLSVQICNNGNDTDPTWETVSSRELQGMVHTFTNQAKTAETWAIKAKVALSRASASGDCYITSLGGTYQ